MDGLLFLRTNFSLICWQFPISLSINCETLMRYYLAPEDIVSELKELRKSQNYMQSHGTGQDFYRGEVAARIELLSKIAKCRLIDEEGLKCLK